MSFSCGICLIFILFSCGSESNDEPLNTKILGTWNTFSKESGNQNFGSTNTYSEDSTFFYFYGDYSERGKYYVSDSILFTTNLNGGNKINYKIIELSDSIFKHISVLNEDTVTFYKAGK